MLVDRAFGLVAAEEVGQLAHGAAVRDARRHVWPLAGVEALREEPAELVEGRLRAEDSVRVMVDEPDPAQYFEKWPCCSNASSPTE